MRRSGLRTTTLMSGLVLLLAGCGGSKADPKAEAPPPVTVEHEQDANLVVVEHAEQFPLATAVEHISTTQLVATGAISPDISRTVPVISLAAVLAGRETRLEKLQR